MTAEILEAVPNFSEGRERSTIEAVVGAAEDAGAEVLDWSLDPDHHRAVVTLVGKPAVVERATLRAAAVAVERIDLRRHSGVHPRIGALDVLPFVPLLGLTLEDARLSAARVARALAEEVGIPVYLYGAASRPPGRSLSELRRGGFEALVSGWPADRLPDLLPPNWNHPGAHPTAGAACVGARPLLLAWNVYLDGLEIEAARKIASRIRGASGGFAGLRALALELPRQSALQISMNLEDLRETSPMDVFRAIEEQATQVGGSVRETEVIGVLPDPLLLAAAADRLRLRDPRAARLLSRRLLNHLAERFGCAELSDE